MAERHVLGISGGKDSAALAIYMRQHYPELDIEYFSLTQERNYLRFMNF